MYKMLYDCDRCDRATSELPYIGKNGDALCPDCFEKENSKHRLVYA